MKVNELTQERCFFVLPNTYIGGAEQVLYQLAKAYSESKSIHVYFLSTKKDSSWSTLSTNITLHFSKSNYKFISICNLMLFLLKRNVHWEYVFSSHVNVNGFLGIFRKLGILTSKKFIARESTTIFNRFSGFKLFIYKTMYSLGYKQIDLLICQTDEMQDHLSEFLPYLQHQIKIRTIPNPVDFEFLESEREKKGVIKLKKTIVSAGRLIEAKAYDVLIDAFKVLQKTYPKYRLVILGEGPLRKELSEKVKKLQLSDKIEMPGFKKNILSYFKEAEVCVVSSRVEGFPNVLLQMMSQNTNVVSTLCAGGINRIKGIYTAKINNPEDLALKIEKCLNQNNADKRILFDQELKSRNIGNFVREIEYHLNEKS